MQEPIAEADDETPVHGDDIENCEKLDNLSWNTIRSQS
jgi:hypothetical protein